MDFMVIEVPTKILSLKISYKLASPTNSKLLYALRDGAHNIQSMSEQCVAMVAIAYLKFSTIYNSIIYIAIE